MSLNLLFTVEQLANIQCIFGYEQIETIWPTEGKYNNFQFKYTQCDHNLLRFYRTLDKNNQLKLVSYLSESLEE